MTLSKIFADFSGRHVALPSLEPRQIHHTLRTMIRFVPGTEIVNIERALPCHFRVTGDTMFSGVSGEAGMRTDLMMLKRLTERTLLLRRPAGSCH